MILSTDIDTSSPVEAEPRSPRAARAWLLTATGAGEARVVRVEQVGDRLTVYADGAEPRWLMAAGAAAQRRVCDRIARERADARARDVRIRGAR